MFQKDKLTALVKNSWSFSFIVSQAFKREHMVVIGRQKLLTLSFCYKAYLSTLLPQQKNKHPAELQRALSKHTSFFSSLHNL